LEVWPSLRQKHDLNSCLIQVFLQCPLSQEVLSIFVGRLTVPWVGKIVGELVNEFRGGQGWGWECDSAPNHHTGHKEQLGSFSGASTINQVESLKLPGALYQKGKFPLPSTLTFFYSLPPTVL
jgi:hypothetical protein